MSHLIATARCGWQMGVVMRPLSLGLASVLVACAPTPPPASVSPVAASGSASTSLSAAPSSPVTFIEDDYPRARDLARSSGKPLFIDAWAPWCHTCLSMKSYVFTDEAMRPLSGKFVWLSIDTEKPENAAFVAKFPMQFWPTLWVVDPKTEAPALKWLGSATAKELSSLLSVMAQEALTSNQAGEGLEEFLEGARASADGKHADAIRAYRASLAAAPPQWRQRGRVDEALISELWAIKDDAACATLAEQEMAKIPPGTSLANVGLFGLQCARRSPDGSAAKGLAPRLARAVEQLALDASVPILDDDRSGLFEEVVEERTADHDTAGAKSRATSWATFLEGRASTARSPDARAVFDAHRVLAYIALGDPGRALPMLTQSEKDFPRDYNPPARIAKVMLELHRYDDGLVAIDRALSKGYGPRKLRLYALKTDLLAAKGDALGASTIADEAVAYSATLPEGERPLGLLAELRKKGSSPKPMPAAK
jgi:thiol-disulfide isomerase/thioredoxin